MSSLAFNAALFDTNDNDNSSSINSKRTDNTYNKTIKRHLPSPNKIKNMKSQLVLQGIDNENSDLADFNPPDKPTSAGVERTIEREPDVSIEPSESAYMLNKGIPANLNNNYEQQYGDTIQHYDKQPGSDNGDIISKLNYMIHMLEEQREIKTGSASEDVILYSFLGVFIIFVLDSFARAGKYSR